MNKQNPLLEDLVDVHYTDRFGVKKKLRQVEINKKEALDNLLKAYEIITSQHSKGLSILKSLKSKIEIFDHQIMAAKRVKNDLNGHALLADEVGLGKTIEAGILLKEYYTTGLIKSALILVPPSLVGQWRSEMESKFDLDFVANKDDDRFQGYDRHSMLIASLSSAHMQNNAVDLNSIDWDMVVVDEAHRLKNPKTKAHQFVKTLPRKFLLLLSATPVQNNLHELYSLVELIRPGHLGTWGNFQGKFLQEENGRNIRMENRDELQDALSQVIVRTTRDEVKYIDFTDRIPKTHILESSELEKNLYAAATNFIRDLWGGGGGNILPLMTLQRQLSSSTSTVIPALRRKMTGDPTDKEEIEKLISMAEQINMDTKMAKLKEIIQNDSESKFLIFTEYRDTQDYVYDCLEDEKFTVVKFNGQMSTSERDAAVSKFQRDAQIMVATEAGGEGKNFQFCHNVINYDLPWNPMRVEQRVGRVHRIGQKEDVIIHNFAIEDTIEEYVLKLLYEKVNLFKMTIGELDLLFGDIDPKKIESTIFESYISSTNKKDIENKFSALGKEWSEDKVKLEETLNEFNPEVFSNFNLSALEES
jgi:SNF2 family DNA or RNA helicase